MEPLRASPASVSGATASTVSQQGRHCLSTPPRTWPRRTCRGGQRAWAPTPHAWQACHSGPAALPSPLLTLPPRGHEQLCTDHAPCLGSPTGPAPASPQRHREAATTHPAVAVSSPSLMPLTHARSQHRCPARVGTGRRDPRPPLASPIAAKDPLCRPVPASQVNNGRYGLTTVATLARPAPQLPAPQQGAQRSNTASASAANTWGKSEPETT